MANSGGSSLKNIYKGIHVSMAEGRSKSYSVEAGNHRPGIDLPNAGFLDEEFKIS